MKMFVFRSLNIYSTHKCTRPHIAHTTMYLSSNAFHHQPGYRHDCSSLGVVERALGVVQTGQGSDLLLRNGGLVW